MDLARLDYTAIRYTAVIFPFVPLLTKIVLFFEKKKKWPVNAKLIFTRGNVFVLTIFFFFQKLSN